MNRLITSYCYELKKLLIYRKGWLFLLGILVLQAVTAIVAKPSQYDAFDRKLYASYTETYSGVCSTETENAILAEKQAADTVMNQTDAVQVTDAEEISRQTEQKMLAAMKSAALAELQNKYSRLASCREMQPVLTYDLDLTAYLRLFGMNWASLLGMLFLIPMLMLGDAECGMEQILFPTRTGKSTVIRAKLLAAVTVGTGLTVVCSVMQWVLLRIRWNMGMLNVPVQSITGFELCGIHGSVRACMILFWILRILAAPASALLLCMLVSVIRKAPASIAVAVILIAVSASAAEKLPSVSPFFLVSACSGIGAMKLYALPDLVFLIFFLLLKTAIFRYAAELAAERPHH
ncbi:MAG: hypothetical protein J5753_03450 [Oscillospiraceae bacterium]|nr:hypothetical protein [Oscillospiraceae bacterium]